MNKAEAAVTRILVSLAFADNIIAGAYASYSIVTMYPWPSAMTN